MPARTWSRAAAKPIRLRQSQASRTWASCVQSGLGSVHELKAARNSSSVMAREGHGPAGRGSPASLPQLLAVLLGPVAVAEGVKYFDEPPKGLGQFVLVLVVNGFDPEKRLAGVLGPSEGEEEFAAGVEPGGA